MTKQKNMYDRLFALLVFFYVLTGYAHAGDTGAGVTGSMTPSISDGAVLSAETPAGDSSAAREAANLSDSNGVAKTDEKPLTVEMAKAADSDASDDESGEDDDLFADESPFDSIKEEFSESSLVADPLMRYNRFMFAVNDKLYFWCLKPVTYGYKAITPNFFRVGVRNFFHNLTTPVRFVNSAIQGKVRGAGSELGRFVVNSTVGVVGVWDPAEQYLGWKPSEEDLGQSLGKYKIGNGFYIVWPFFGPSTLRDSVGMVGDFFLDPVNYLSRVELAMGAEGLDVVNRTSFRLGDYEAVKAASMDPYVMVRDFYIEYRNKKIKE